MKLQLSWQFETTQCWNLWLHNDRLKYWLYHNLKLIGVVNVLYPCHCHIKCWVSSYMKRSAIGWGKLWHGKESATYDNRTPTSPAETIWSWSLACSACYSPLTRTREWRTYPSGMIHVSRTHSQGCQSWCQLFADSSLQFKQNYVNTRVICRQQMLPTYNKSNIKW